MGEALTEDAFISAWEFEHNVDGEDIYDELQAAVEAVERDRDGGR